jgi:hypothetical protein
MKKTQELETGRPLGRDPIRTTISSILAIHKALTAVKYSSVKGWITSLIRMKSQSTIENMTKSKQKLELIGHRRKC